MVISIKKAEYRGDYKIFMKFSDGIERVIDFKNYLSKAMNPMTSKLLNKKEFEKFKVEYGDLVWNDFELCFPIWDLHEGKL